MDRDSVFRVGGLSDRSSSPVEHEPLLEVIWVGVLDSQSILVGTDVLSNIECSVCGHSRFDLEFDSASEWIFWEVNSLSVDNPTLRRIASASPPHYLFSVGVFSTIKIKAMSWDVSDVLACTTIVGRSLISFSDPLSNNSLLGSQESLTSLVGNGKVSSGGWSNSSSSSVEEPPLLAIERLVVLDSQCILFSTYVFMMR